MFGLFKGTKDFAAMSNSFDAVHQMIQEIAPKFDSAIDKSEFKEYFCALAYMCRAGIMDRLEKYEWPLTSEVFVPSISNKNVTIYVALTKTKYVVLTAGAMVGAMNEINEIMNKGELFHTLDRRMPVQIKSKLGL
jgi:hypothetical protein